MPRYTPWPRQAHEHYLTIKEEEGILRAMIETLLSEGIGQRNYKLIEMLAPRIETRAERIRSACRDAQGYDTRRRGRVPKWSEAAMEICALAGRITEHIQAVQVEYQSNRWRTITHLLKACQKAVNSIAEQISTVAVETTVPEAFYEVAV